MAWTTIVLKVANLQRHLTTFSSKWPTPPLCSNKTISRLASISCTLRSCMGALIPGRSQLLCDCYSHRYHDPTGSHSSHPLYIDPHPSSSSSRSLLALSLRFCLLLICLSCSPSSLSVSFCLLLIYLSSLDHLFSSSLLLHHLISSHLSSPTQRKPQPSGPTATYLPTYVPTFSSQQQAPKNFKIDFLKCFCASSLISSRISSGSFLRHHSKMDHKSSNPQPNRCGIYLQKQLKIFFYPPYLPPTCFTKEALLM